MQFEPSERSTAAADLEAIPTPARRTLHNLGVDRAAVEVLDAFASNNVRAVLLKGPSVARWLYETGARTYVDVDVLVAPDDVSAAQQVLTGLGYSTTAPPTLPLDRPAYQEWARRPEEPTIDLHPTLNLLEQVPPRVVWEVVERHTEPFELLGGSVTVLAPGARAFHVALHALSHGERSHQAQTDLGRAVAILDDAVWVEAAAFAREMSAEPLLSAGLHEHPDGGSLASRLGLERSESTATSIRANVSGEKERSAALAVDWWRDLSLGDKFRLLIPKMFPSSGYLQARSEWARRGGLWFVAARVARPFVVLGWGMRGLTMWLKARRRLR